MILSEVLTLDRYSSRSRAEKVTYLQNLVQVLINSENDVMKPLGSEKFSQNSSKRMSLCVSPSADILLNKPNQQNSLGRTAPHKDSTGAG
jgi:hypothetical protein